jgi:heme/copper-type cytochrome/quinol oxidase subunit 2
VYFFFYLVFMTFMLEQTRSSAPGSSLAFLTDAFGAGIVIPDILAAVKVLYPAQADWGWALGFVSLSKPATTFIWDGITWTPGMLAGRVFWVAIAVAVALAGSVFFDRFDSAVVARKPEKARALPEASVTKAKGAKAFRLNPLAAGARRFSYFGVLIAELRLLVKGRKWWWYAGAVLIIIAGLLSPAETARGWVLLAAIIWPLFLWSSLGCREKTWNTGPLVFPAPKPVSVQLSTSWLSGFLVSLAICSGILVSLLLASDLGGVLAVIAGALLIPSMALAMGIWSGTSKLFEAVYLALWYVGPMNHFPALDYAGVTAGSGAGLPLAWAGLGLVFAALAIAGRYRQIYL